MVQTDDQLVLAETGDFGSKLTNVAETLVQASIRLNRLVTLRGTFYPELRYLNLLVLEASNFVIIFNKYDQPIR